MEHTVKLLEILASLSSHGEDKSGAVVVERRGGSCGG
jgi:hypothetical protein